VAAEAPPAGIPQCLVCTKNLQEGKMTCRRRGAISASDVEKSRPVALVQELAPGVPCTIFSAETSRTDGKEPACCAFQKAQPEQTRGQWAMGSLHQFLFVLPCITPSSFPIKLPDDAGSPLPALAPDGSPPGAKTMKNTPVSKSKRHHPQCPMIGVAGRG